MDSALVRSPERQETANQRRRRPEDRPVNDPDRTALALQVTTQRIRYRHAMCVKPGSEDVLHVIPPSPDTKMLPAAVA